MVDVATALVEFPLLWFVMLLTGRISFLFFFGLSLLVFWCVGRDIALAITFMTAQRNFGLILAVAGNVFSDITWLYFASNQLPVYLSPHFLESIAKRLKRADPTGKL